MSRIDQLSKENFLQHVERALTFPFLANEVEDGTWWVGLLEKSETNADMIWCSEHLYSSQECDFKIEVVAIGKGVNKLTFCPNGDSEYYWWVGCSFLTPYTWSGHSSHLMNRAASIHNTYTNIRTVRTNIKNVNPKIVFNANSRFEPEEKVKSIVVNTHYNDRCKRTFDEALLACLTHQFNSLSVMCLDQTSLEGIGVQTDPIAILSSLCGWDSSVACDNPPHYIPNKSHPNIGFGLKQNYRENTLSLCVAQDQYSGLPTPTPDRQRWLAPCALYDTGASNDFLSALWALQSGYSKMLPKYMMAASELLADCRYGEEN